MTNETDVRAAPKPRVGMTPLWVISLFVSLTEVVAGITVTQADGATQTALTVFVIGFPLLVAGAFFWILWNRPYVFYPPSEFATGVEVSKYVQAMGSSVDPIRADLQAEVSNLRAKAARDSSAMRKQILTLEDFLAKISRQTADSQIDYDKYRSAVEVEREREEENRNEFELRARYRIHVTSVTEDASTDEQADRVEQIASILRQFGYRTSTGGLGSSFYLKGYRRGSDWKRIRVIFPNGSPELAREVIELLRDRVDVPLEPLEASEALRNSEMMEKHELLQFLPSKDLDLTVAYCMD